MRRETAMPDMAAVRGVRRGEAANFSASGSRLGLGGAEVMALAVEERTERREGEGERDSSKGEKEKSDEDDGAKS